jgi:hypothetical protein
MVKHAHVVAEVSVQTLLVRGRMLEIAHEHCRVALEQSAAHDRLDNILDPAVDRGYASGPIA